MSLEYICIECGRTFARYNQLNRRCPKCTYNRYAKPKKPLKQMGKVAKKWIEVRHDFIKTQIPDKNGLYTCGICGGSLSYDEITVDHKLPRSNRPDLRYDHDNLQIAHWSCNSEKGSKH